MTEKQDEQEGWKEVDDKVCSVCGKPFEKGAKIMRAKGERVHKGRCFAIKTLGAVPTCDVCQKEVSPLEARSVDGKMVHAGACFQVRIKENLEEGSLAGRIAYKPLVTRSMILHGWWILWGACVFVAFLVLAFPGEGIYDFWGNMVVVTHFVVPGCLAFAEILGAFGTPNIFARNAVNELKQKRDVVPSVVVSDRFTIYFMEHYIQITFPCMEYINISYHEFAAFMMNEKMIAEVGKHLEADPDKPGPGEREAILAHLLEDEDAMKKMTSDIEMASKGQPPEAKPEAVQEAKDAKATEVLTGLVEDLNKVEKATRPDKIRNMKGGKK